MSDHLRETSWCKYSVAQQKATPTRASPTSRWLTPYLTFFGAVRSELRRSESPCDPAFRIRGGPQRPPPTSRRTNLKTALATSLLGRHRGFESSRPDHPRDIAVRQAGAPTPAPHRSGDHEGASTPRMGGGSSERFARAAPASGAKRSGHHPASCWRDDRSRPSEVDLGASGHHRRRAPFGATRG